MRRQYANPPVIEASCDVKFGDGPEWDIILPGRIFARLRENYGAKPRVIPQPPGSDFADPTPGSRSRIALSSSDNSRRIEFREDAISIQVLKPYPGWETFEANISDALRSYLAVAKPGTVSSIRLRYRNEIKFPTTEFIFQEHFTVGTIIPSAFPKTVSSFYNGFSAHYPDDDSTRLRVAFSSLSPAAGIAARLDIDILRTSIDESATLARILRVVKKLKVRETEAFEALITDKTRELFA